MQFIIQKFEIQLDYSFHDFSMRFSKNYANNDSFFRSIKSNECLHPIDNNTYCYYLTNNIISTKQNSLSNFKAHIELMSNNNVICKVYFKNKIVLGYFILAFFFLYLGLFNNNTIEPFPLFALFIGTIILYKDSVSFKKFMIQKLNYEWADYK